MIRRLLTTGLLLTGMITANAQKAKVYPEQSQLQDIRETLSQTMNANKLSTLPPLPDGDTLGYFVNKHVTQNTGTQSNGFFTVKMPYVQTGTNVPVINEVGSSFLNPGNATITVYGGYALCLRHAASVSPSVAIRLYIYSATPSGQPVAKLDSAMTSVTSSTIGTYCNATFTSPVTVTGAFYMSYKPIVTAGDTLRYFINNGQPAGTVTPQQYGEGLSWTRFNGNFVNNTGFFGANTEYENLVVPFVAFTYSAGAAIPPTNTTNPTGYCAHQVVTFTSTSIPSSILDNRQFNFNAFGPYWAPFVNTPSVAPSRTAESTYNWSFTTGTLVTTGTGPMPQIAWANPGTTNGSLIVKYQHSSMFGRTSKTQNTFTIPTLTVVNCGLVGMGETFMNADLSVFPNPAINGKTNIKGLEGKNTIAVYNMIGQQVSYFVTESENAEVDLNSQPVGTYMIRVTDSSNRSKTVKVIKD